MKHSEVGALKQLIAEVEDDLQQMDRLAAGAAARLPELVSDSCTPEVAAFAALQLHRWYSACEAALERIERTLVAAPASGDSWHQDLLRLMALEIEGARPPVLRRETAERLMPYLRFRHFLRHAYAVELDPCKLVALVDPLTEVQAAVQADVAGFVAGLRQALRAAR